MRLRLEVVVGRDGITARVRRGRRIVWSGDAECAALEQVTDAMSQLRAQDGFPGRCRGVRFLVEPPVAQLRTLHDLPPVRPRELRRLVQQQSMRFFRRRNGPLTIDARWLDRKTGAVRAVALDTRWIDALHDAAAALDMRVIDIAAANGPHTGSVTLRFSTGARESKRWVKRGAAAILVLAWIGVSHLAGYVMDLELDRRALARALENLQPELGVIDAARREIAQVVSVVGVLQDAEATRGWVTRLLSQLATTLPDSTHVVSLAGAPGGVTVRLRGRDLESVLHGLPAGGSAFVVEVEENVTREEGKDDWEVASIRLSEGVHGAGS